LEKVAGFLMAREMAPDGKAYRVVTAALRVGPDLMSTSNYRGTFAIYSQGKTYAVGTYGPYGKPGLAKSQGKRVLAPYIKENIDATRNLQPEPWEITLDVQVADIEWKSI
jgi:hypothetical protein